jgi:hypothetical protein
MASGTIQTGQVELSVAASSTEHALRKAEFDAQVKLNKYDATAAPGVGDDTADGYSVGSNWFDVTADDAYVCLDATAGAAVWKKTTP